VHVHQAEVALVCPFSGRIQVQLAHRLADTQVEPMLSQQAAVPPFEAAQSAVGEQRPEAVTHPKVEMVLVERSIPPPQLAHFPAESLQRGEVPLHHVFSMPLRESIAGWHSS